VAQTWRDRPEFHEQEYNDSWLHTELARLEENASNDELFETLQNWDDQLKHLKPFGPLVPPCP
jgi:hypothetical protein